MVNEAYDELYESDGRLRPGPAAVRDRTGVAVDAPSPVCCDELRGLAARTGQSILPIPLVLTATEFGNVREAIAQRSRMLQHLFHDLFAGRAAVLDRVLPEALVDHVADVHGWTVAALREMWCGRARSDVCFIYGPDLIRAPDGRWHVIEDNIGCLGGVGSAPWVVERYRRASGVAGTESGPGDHDLTVAVGAFLERASSPSPESVICLGGQSACTPGAIAGPEEDLKRAALGPLGLTVVASDHAETDVRRPGVAVPRAMINLGGTLGPPMRGPIGRVFAERRVAMLNAPGTGIIANKAFLPYSDALVRFYLDEAPMISPPTTVLIDGELPADADGVVKRIDGSEGCDVYFLSDWSGADLSIVRDRVAAWGHMRAVWQRFTPASRLPISGHHSWCHFAVELRPIVYEVGAERPLVATVASGRAMLGVGDRRANLARGGHALPVLTEDAT